MRRLRLGGLIAWLAIWLLAPAWAEVPVPVLAARVTDLTGTLSGEQKNGLEGELAALEARRGVQLAVLVVASTRPESIEQYSIRVVEAWKLGRKGTDDGILLLVAKDDRALRIEVGYGLEGNVPDAVARRVIDETIVPRLREGDFAGGIEVGVRHLAALLEEKPEPEGSPAVPEGTVAYAGDLPDVPTWLLISVVAVGSALRWFLGPLAAGLAMGGLVGAAAWFFSGTLATAAIAALITFVFFLVGIVNWLELFLSGSGGSGGRGGGGGFGGGGGGFGGGGASGRW